METVVLVLMISVCFGLMLKQTFRKNYSVAAFALVCALFVGLAWPYAIEQSKSRIGEWLSDPALMLDTSAVLSVEVILQMAFCLLAARMGTSGQVRRRTLLLYRALRWFPGVLIFPVLFSVLVAAIFLFPGASFARVAWCTGAAVAAAILLGTWLLKKALPEKEIRLELLFLTQALIALLGIVATVNGRTAVAGTHEIDWTALAGVLCLTVAGTTAGTTLYRLKTNRKNNNAKRI